MTLRGILTGNGECWPIPHDNQAKGNVKGSTQRQHVVSVLTDRLCDDDVKPDTLSTGRIYRIHAGSTRSCRNQRANEQNDLLQLDPRISVDTCPNDLLDVPGNPHT
jgi:hypothetical protein